MGENIDSRYFSFYSSHDTSLPTGHFGGSTSRVFSPLATSLRGETFGPLSSTRRPDRHRWSVESLRYDWKEHPIDHEMWGNPFTYSAILYPSISRTTHHASILPLNLFIHQSSTDTTLSLAEHLKHAVKSFGLFWNLSSTSHHINVLFPTFQFIT